MHATERALLALGSATLGESGGRPMRARVRPVWTGATLASPAFPVQCTPGDNLAVHAAVARAPLGHALVVDVGSERELGYWGEVLTTAAEARGLTGLVIDGCVRDVAALEAHGFPVFSTGIALPGATKDRPGRIGSPVAVGGVEVAAGDWVIGDVDGVTVVPGDRVEDVLAAGRAREAKETGLFDALRGGQTMLELLGLDADRIDGA
ncbi:MAG: dimethylmenaquinone methyltransferase [Acidimicrobiia bacterium]